MCIILIVIAVLGAWIAFCGYQWGWGPFASLHGTQTTDLPGNDSKYAPEKVSRFPDGPLTGKRVLFLGSSVTYGASAKGISFADDIAARTGCIMVKEAVSGTALADDAPDSYVSRLKGVEGSFDLVVCQLSTNDASQNKPLGNVTPADICSGFDTHTVAGAMEFIISYAGDRWSCPVMFYTNCRYPSDAYAAMVGLLPALREKWGIGVIDLWNNDAFNRISGEQRKLYMADAIHPTQAGYLEWWTPEIERQMEDFLTEGKGYEST